MKSPQRVVWSEGMFMSPQHMQMLDRYHEGLVGARMNAVTPYDWGVLQVELDLRALAAGQLRVAKFAGVLPDGLPIVFDENHPEASPARPIEGHFPPMQRVLEVFLGVANERDGVPNYANGSGNAEGKRFTVTTKGIYDLTAGGTEVSVAFGQRNVQVLFGDESRENYEAIKVAEIVRDATGALLPRENFIPALRRINASSYLIRRLKEILAAMVGKQRSLSQERRQRDGATVEFNAQDVTRFLLLNAVNSFLPVVNHLIEPADVAPEEAFLLLSQFAGALCSFTVDADPTTLPKFLYTDLSTTFDELINRIMLLLNMLVKERYLTVPLESRADGLHFGQLQNDQLPRCKTYVLAIAPTDIPEAVVAQQLPGVSKIASWNDIGSIVNVSVSGVPLVVTYKPPVEIPVKQGLVYFMLNTDAPHWRNVAGERTIAIYLPPPFDPDHVKLTLMAVPPAGG